MFDARMDVVSGAVWWVSTLPSRGTGRTGVKSFIDLTVDIHLAIPQQCGFTEPMASFIGAQWLAGLCIYPALGITLSLHDGQLSVVVHSSHHHVPRCYPPYFHQFEVGGVVMVHVELPEACLHTL